MNKELKLDFNKQVLKTVEFIIFENISTLSLVQSSSQENSCWGQITISLYKKFDRTISLRIWKNWKYNIRRYRDKVHDLLKERGHKTGKKSLNGLKLR
jgi:hypothetical protein